MYTKIVGKLTKHNFLLCSVDMQHCIRRHRTLRRPGDDQNWTHKSKTLGPNLALMVRNKVSDLSVIDRVAFTNHQWRSHGGAQGGTCPPTPSRAGYVIRVNPRSFFLGGGGGADQGLHHGRLD